MNEKKKRSEKKKGKKKAPSGKVSLLKRLFGGRQKKRTKPPSKEKAKPLTPMQRSIAEIQQMTKIGQRDPERLAQLLITMLGKERAKEEADRLAAERKKAAAPSEAKGSEGWPLILGSDLIDLQYIAPNLR